MKTKSLLFIIAGIIAGSVGLYMAKESFSAPEAPVYQVLQKEKEIEVRHYAHQLIAKTTVQGSREKAASNGFKRLASYIFAEDREGPKIPMTVPVVQTPLESTLPRAAESVEGQIASLSNEATRWELAFVMPRNFDLQSIPKPMRDEVMLEQVESQDVVAIEFNGSPTPENLAEHQQKLEAFVKNRELETQGPPMYAFYSAPWTPAPMRRNEVMLRLKNYPRG